MKQTSLALPIAAILAMGGARNALAHAFPDHAQPAVGSTVSPPPASVRIWFTEKLEPAFSRVAVVDARGNNVDRGSPKVDPQDPTLLSVAVKPLAPGTYHVDWHVVSVDTHATQGDFTFTVK
jgi:methionine-rich copper-binding protein CopC